MSEPSKVVLITGANRGLGLQLVKDFAYHGVTVLAGCRDLARGHIAVAGIAGDVHVVQLDVTDSGSINAAAARIEAEFGHLNVLINNAAISNTRMTPGMSIKDYLAISAASQIELEEMRAIWETNVFGVLAVSQAMLPLLRKAPHARIVNISGGSLTENADSAFPFRGFFTPGYVASKTALNAITMAFSIELETSTVKVNAVLPGSTPTQINGFMGGNSVEAAVTEVLRVALAGDEVPNGTFTRATNVTVPW